MIAILIAVYTHNQPQHQQGGGPGAEGFGAGGGEGGGHSGFKDGDWVCPQCNDHQFARNVRCRRCGGPKPGADGAATGGGGIGGQGQGGEGWTSFKQDWECTQCGDYQFARNARCRRCGADRPEVEGAEGEQAPKQAQGGQGPNGGGSAGGGRREGRMTNAKPGDWCCPSCNDIQFARNQVCRRCGEPKPTGPGGNFGGGQGSGGQGSGGQGGGGGGGSGGRHQRAMPGDWSCPMCQDLQFARNAICRRCGAPRPDGEGGGDFQSGNFSGGIGGGGYGHHQGGGGGGRQERGGGRAKQFKSGDWNCSQCGDHVFARNDRCRRCGNPRPN